MHRSKLREHLGQCMTGSGSVGSSKKFLGEIKGTFYTTRQGPRCGPHFSTTSFTLEQSGKADLADLRNSDMQRRQDPRVARLQQATNPCVLQAEQSTNPRSRLSRARTRAPGRAGQASHEPVLRAGRGSARPWSQHSGGRGRWISEFQASLVYRVSSRTAGLHRETLSGKKQKKTKKKKEVLPGGGGARL